VWAHRPLPHDACVSGRLELNEQYATKTVLVTLKVSSNSAYAPAVSVAAFASPWLNEPALSDFVVACGARRFDCHRIVLAGRSEFFRTMLTGDFKEARESRVEISAFGPEVTELLIRYNCFLGVWGDRMWYIWPIDCQYVTYCMMRMWDRNVCFGGFQYCLHS
jgi:hypothetical protein